MARAVVFMRDTNVNSAIMRQVIEVRSLVGKGVEGSPITEIVEYYDLEGKILARHTPFENLGRGAFVPQGDAILDEQDLRKAERPFLQDNHLREGEISYADESGEFTDKQANFSTHRMSEQLRAAAARMDAPGKDE